MSEKTGQFTSDKRGPGGCVWSDRDDWEAGDVSEVAIEEGMLVFRNVLHSQYGDGFYLYDDWMDGGLKTRDGSVETKHNGVTGFYRPTWIVDLGSPSVTDGELKINSGDGVVCELNLDLTEEITWIWKQVDPRSGGTGNSDESSLQVWSESKTRLTGYPSEALYPGYILEIRRQASADEIRLSKVRGDQSVERLIYKQSVSWPADVQVKRSPDGKWRLWLDDDLVGSAVDTELNSPRYIGFGGRSSMTIGLMVSEFVVF